MVRGLRQAPIDDGQRAQGSGLSAAAYPEIEAALAPFGLIARGGFRPAAEDGVPRDATAVVMVGNAGPAMWRAFAAGNDGGPDALNRWTRRVLDGIAEGLGCRALYPFGGPPWLPFQRWARKAEPVFPSPVGMLIHPEYGLWHAWRGALAFDREVDGLPARREVTSPCESCSAKPCLTSCPVGAFSAAGYDVDGCAAHLRRSEGADCMALGCRARRACPVGRDYLYEPAQSEFHMAAFLAARRAT